MRRTFRRRCNRRDGIEPHSARTKQSASPDDDVHYTVLNYLIVIIVVIKEFNLPTSLLLF